MQHLEHYWRYVQAVSDDLYSHVLHCIYALYGAGHLEFVLLVYYRHSVVEVCGMRHTGFVSLYHVLISGACAGESGKYAVHITCLDEAHRARQLWSFIPTLYALVLA